MTALRPSRLAWRALIVVVLAPLALSGCLWGPGKFKSDLALHKDGHFVLDYRGQILIQMPEDKDRPSPWSAAMAVCYTDGRAENSLARIVPPGETPPAPQGSRRCTATELAKLKADHEKQSAERAKRQGEESARMAKMFGLPGVDDASNRAFADKLMKYQGWRSVIYRGKGVFDVIYRHEGRLEQDFAFPMMPDSDLILPFVAIRRRSDGSVQVTAPAFTGGSGAFGARALALGIPNSEMNGGPKSAAQGVFTITTDGEILTNNSEDGPAATASGRQVLWEVGSGSKRIPEMLVRL